MILNTEKIKIENNKENNNINENRSLVVFNQKEIEILKKKKVNYDTLSKIKTFKNVFNCVIVS